MADSIPGAGKLNNGMIKKEINSFRRINLHLHTNVSDGILSPAELVKEAKAKGLELISITDHDSADAYKMLPPTLTPLNILPGMEISSMHKGHDVHILAYGCDFDNQALIEMTEMYLVGRRERAQKMLKLLAQMGLEISLQEVIAVAGSRELIVRPHIAQVMIKKGFVQNKNEAFDKYIGNFKPAFVPKPELKVESVIKLIHDAGGFALIAHPGKLTNAAFIYDIIDMGIDGLEVWHPDHYPTEVENFITIAQKNGLLMTAGSDYHGDSERNSLLDYVQVSEEILDSINALWQEYKWRLNTRSS
ncbi:MAG: PHP domain-containing protein [Candidatus Cloacimonetes bacterium]|nr:PHP domain-containing protein [Candidatus Cloacimonadota bacterium]